MANPKNASIATTNIFNLPEPSRVEGGDNSNFLTQLYYALNSMSLLLNLKETGQYSPQEFTCGQQYKFGNKPQQVVRKVIDFGALPNAGTKNVAHGITFNASTVFTRIYGAATDPAGINYLPLPYASTTLNNNIELKVDTTNVTVTTGINRAAFTKTYIVLEWLKF